MPFRIAGLDPAPFRHLYGLSDDALAAQGARRCAVDETPGFADRVELREVDAGEHVLLVNHFHQPADTPFRSCHAIFVREGATEARVLTDEIPQSLLMRTISLRAFDTGHEMVDADLAEGDALQPLIEQFLGREDVAYLHAHYARRGCYAARIERG